ncbi:hypothetical protein H0H92_015444 [Tricholoma furcatifolium]|nr:hypothetical protein H0H92_015444 [Tricholoma furcatifolium]
MRRKNVECEEVEESDDSSIEVIKSSDGSDGEKSDSSDASNNEAGSLQEKHQAMVSEAIRTKEDSTKDLRLIFSALVDVEFSKKGLKEVEMDLKKLQEKEKKKQLVLDGVIVKVNGPKEFSKTGTTHAVAQLVACDDQAFALASKPLFRNCLVSMCPKTKSSELPTSYNVSTHIHNEFVHLIDALKQDIIAAPGRISITADTWSADNTKIGYLGVTTHWIQIVDHGGKNLGQYLVVLTAIPPPVVLRDL